MWVRVLVFVGIAVLLYIGIKILIRAFPNSIDKSTLEGMKRLGDFTIAVSPGMPFGQLGGILAKKIVLQGVLEAVPAIVVSEQKKVIGDKILEMERRFARVKSGKAVKYFVSPIVSMGEVIVGWRKMLSNGLFDCGRMLSEIEGFKQAINKYLSHIHQVEGMFQEAHNLLEQVKTQITDTEILAAVKELEGTLTNYASMKIDFEDIDAVMSLKEELSKIIISLKQCLMVDGSGKVVSVNYYEILEVDPKATDEEIKKAYRQKLMQYHPDKKEAELRKIEDEDVREEVERVFNEKITLINEAYETLSNLEKRRIYDESVVK